MKQIQVLELLPRLVLACALLAVAACAPKIDNKGYIQTANWKESVIVGQTTKQEIQDKFGSPSAQSTFGGDTWYYLSSRKETVGLFKPEVAQQDSVRLAFDASGVVSSIDNFNKDSGQDIEMVKRTTPTEGHSLNFFEQVLGNVGRFNGAGGGNSPISPGRRPSSSGGF